MVPITSILSALYAATCIARRTRSDPFVLHNYSRFIEFRAELLGLTAHAEPLARDGKAAHRIWAQRRADGRICAESRPGAGALDDRCASAESELRTVERLQRPAGVPAHQRR